MKVLTHEGVLVTLPFSLKGLKDSEFERVDGGGGSKVGIVAELSEAAVRRAVSGAVGDYSTPREMMNDIRFIARSLSAVEVGAEIRLQKTGDRIALVVPQNARPAQRAVTVGARVVFNGRVSPKAAVNARGSVESINGKKAIVKLDAGDRRRLTQATGRDYPESITTAVEFLDVIEDEQS
jgi:hypothetical protein